MAFHRDTRRPRHGIPHDRDKAYPTTATCFDGLWKYRRNARFSVARCFCTIFSVRIVGVFQTRVAASKERSHGQTLHRKSGWSKRREMALAGSSPSEPATPKRARKAMALAGPSPSEPATPKRARKLKTEAIEEKRMARFVKSPSVAVRERIQRAYQHRLYLIEKMMTGEEESSPTGCEFFVLGATGNVYSVILEKRPSCTCPDAAKGNVCKHLLFVMLRVLKLPESDPRVWQKALLTNELEDLLTISATNEGVLASQLVRQRFHEITETKPESSSGPSEVERSMRRELDGDCPICYEAMASGDGKPKEPVVFCKSCGNNVHRDCFEKWSHSKRSTGDKVTCIYCRADWLDSMRNSSQNGKSDGGDGYVNLASFSEAHARQDTSLASLYPNTWEWMESRSRRR